MTRAMAVAGTEFDGVWTVTISVADVDWKRETGGTDRQCQRFTAKASTLAYAIASATLQAKSAGVQIDG